MTQFDTYALEKIKDLLATRDKQVGRLYEGDKTGKKQTDCITFVTEVLEYAYEKLGHKNVAAQVRKYAKKGTSLAAFLVSSRVWRAHYFNPDVNHPRDNDSEHSYSYTVAKKHKTYYKIPLAGGIINYNPTPLTKDPTQPRTIALAHFKFVPFAVGIARGGWHTFLCSYGSVYEVHWKGIGDSLYELSDFVSYPWLSGAVIVPPRTSFTSDAL